MELLGMCLTIHHIEKYFIEEQDILFILCLYISVLYETRLLRRTVNFYLKRLLAYTLELISSNLTHDIDFLG
jgi:hypothetical protein